MAAAASIVALTGGRACSGFEGIGGVDGSAVEGCVDRPCCCELLPQGCCACLRRLRARLFDSSRRACRGVDCLRGCCGCLRVQCFGVCVCRQGGRGLAACRFCRSLGLSLCSACAAVACGCSYAAASACTCASSSAAVARALLAMALMASISACAAAFLSAASVSACTRWACRRAASCGRCGSCTAASTAPSTLACTRRWPELLCAWALMVAAAAVAPAPVAANEASLRLMRAQRRGWEQQTGPCLSGWGVGAGCMAVGLASDG